jgi:alpha-D-ribose 1-methylphosphonate 5-triphosphate synthase subunit PhnG
VNTVSTVNSTAFLDSRTDAGRATSSLFDRNRRSEILNMASSDELACWVDEFIDPTASIVLRRSPEVGMVMVQITEPVGNDNFYLGEVLVTRAEVEVAGYPGWAMRLGDDSVGALAGALLDAWATTSDDAANAVDLRCAMTLAQCWQREIEEWEMLRRTEVRFDELESDRARKDRR